MMENKLGAAPSLPPPHVAVIPCPTQGHVNPMLHLAKKLASQGLRVTFVNTQHNHQRLMQAQAQSGIPLPQDLGLPFQWLAIPFPPPAKTVVEICQQLLRYRQSEFFSQLLSQLQQLTPPLTCLIADLFIPFAQDVADALHLPRVSFWCQSGASFASHLVFGKGFRPPPLADGASNLITCIPGAPPLHLSEIPAFLQSCDPSDSMYIFVITAFLHIRSPACILLNTFDQLEQTCTQALSKEAEIFTVGPVLHTDFVGAASNPLHSRGIGTTFWAEEYHCLEWLDKYRPSSVLFVAFGSHINLPTEQIREMALGLEMSEQPFLWVVRPNLVEGDAAIFPDGFEDRMKGRALLISWAPQLKVLSHASIGGFLTHCGWNSALESIATGVPMLSWPTYFNDQMLNRRFVVGEWKIGLNVEEENGVVVREEVERKVRALLQGEEGREVRERAIEMRDAASRACGPKGSSHTNLESFINLVKSFPQQTM